MFHQTHSFQPRAVLWDLDGTLIDTAPIHWQAWRDTLTGEGFDLTWEIFAPTFGQRNDTVLRNWLKPDLPAAEISRISDSKEALYRKVIQTYPLELLPGAARWLAFLHDSGWRQALATMTWQENLQAIFKVCDFRQYFDAIVTADAVQHGKPDPEVFLTAAERLGVRPARCIVIEDSPAGVESAHRAGMQAIGVGKLAGQADWVTNQLTDLTEKVFDDLVKNALYD